MAETPKPNKQEEILKFASFAVLDLETNTLPSLNYFKVSITELSVYGFSINELKNLLKNGKSNNVPEKSSPVPPSPRVLHKLTLLLNPRSLIHPDSEKITGLDNYLLENENHFNDNAAQTLIGFLQHLPQPVCLVAHNGWFFDFPIVKQALDKLNMTLPSETVCLDSMIAFIEIDKQREITRELKEIEKESEETSLPPSLEEVLVENSSIDWKTLNENTPKRSTNTTTAAQKRKLLAEGIIDFDGNSNSLKRPTYEVSGYTKSKRSLFPSSTNKKKQPKHLTKIYPKKGVYKLNLMYERLFGQKPSQSHYAEADVDALTKIIQYYGEDFISYALEHAVEFEKMPKLHEIK